MTKHKHTAEFSNIITPPDFINDNKVETIVIIDPEMSEIEDVAYFLKTAAKSFNVYVYRSDMDDQRWLAGAVTKASAVVINTAVSDISHIKDKLVATNAHNHYYYGPKNFLTNHNRIEKPVDFFVKGAK